MMHLICVKIKKKEFIIKNFSHLPLGESGYFSSLLRTSPTFSKLTVPRLGNLSLRSFVLICFCAALSVMSISLTWRYLKKTKLNKESKEEEKSHRSYEINNKEAEMFRVRDQVISDEIGRVNEEKDEFSAFEATHKERIARLIADASESEEKNELFTFGSKDELRRYGVSDEYTITADEFEPVLFFIELNEVTLMTYYNINSSPISEIKYPDVVGFMTSLGGSDALEESATKIINLKDAYLTSQLNSGQRASLRKAITRFVNRFKIFYNETESETLPALLSSISPLSPSCRDLMYS